MFLHMSPILASVRYAPPSRDPLAAWARDRASGRPPRPVAQFCDRTGVETLLDLGLRLRRPLRDRRQLRPVLVRTEPFAVPAAAAGDQDGAEARYDEERAPHWGGTRSGWRGSPSSGSGSHGAAYAVNCRYEGL